MLLWALEEIETVQLSMELVEGYVVSAADFGSTFLDTTKITSSRFRDGEEVEAEGLADEFRTGAVFKFAGLLKLLRYGRRK